VVVVVLPVVLLRRLSWWRRRRRRWRRRCLIVLKDHGRNMRTLGRHRNDLAPRAHLGRRQLGKCAGRNLLCD
jgi:hypothetical protein